MSAPLIFKGAALGGGYLIGVVIYQTLRYHIYWCAMLWMSVVERKTGERKILRFSFFKNSFFVWLVWLRLMKNVKYAEIQKEWQTELQKIVIVSVCQFC